MHNEFIAHYRKLDQKVQTVYDHLTGVSDICKNHTGKIGMPDEGMILGLLHDLGKYSGQFQAYIQSATGLIDCDIDDTYINTNGLKGKIDHSTAGAQWVWQRFRRYGLQGRLAGQILAVCLASHHGGLIDCLRPDGSNGFTDRMRKEDKKTHLHECLHVVEKMIFTALEEVGSESFIKNFCCRLKKIINPLKYKSECVRNFRLGFFNRFLFSCLIDADRIDSADFENPENIQFRSTQKIDWQIAIDRFEKKLEFLPIRNNIDTIRRTISVQCKERAKYSQGIYTLTVPTGGGKTFASMRYALHHAKKHNLDHIIYIIPYTSIIEQNAEKIRKMLEKEGDGFSWVLEHHSNLESEKQTWHSKLTAENWDSPIIFTTMVQFLEVLFGGGTRGARRMHNIANSVLIFDEIQNLPVSCVHLFCNAIQFFVDYARTTSVLCTATQPLLDNLKAPDKGQLIMSEDHELVQNTSDLFNQLKRVEIKNCIRPEGEGWLEEEIGNLSVNQLEEQGNCLVIVNTKKWARALFQYCIKKANVKEDTLFYLSTNLCPAQRKQKLNVIQQRLNGELPVLCISTQLIEAGVDIDFNSVIRFLAGLDSIAQAAGRCNRNGEYRNHRGDLDKAQVWVVNPREEKIDMLPDIKIGRNKASLVLSEKKNANLLDPDVMKLYFLYYFYERSDSMDYSVTAQQAGRDDSLLNLLSDNPKNIGSQNQSLKLQQSFKTAGKAFKTIEAPTQAVIVPFEEGRDIIAGLCADFEPSKAYQLLRQAQQYSVNVYPNVWKKLISADAVRPVQEGEEIYYLDERYYSSAFGLSTEIVSNMDVQIV